MKSQNDIIISAVAIVLALIFLAVFYFTQHTPVVPPKPEAVILTKPSFQAGAVVMADKLPGASQQQSSGGGGRGAPGGGGGGRPSAPGPGAAPVGGPGGSQFQVGTSGASSGR